MQLKNTIKDALPTFARQLCTPRVINAISIGTPKSGTTSIAKLFSNNFRQEHEADKYDHVDTILNHFNKKITDDEYVEYLRRRDKRLWLDLEANCFLGYRADLVLKAFPNNKFILTIREPYQWLGSIFDNNINHQPAKNNIEEKWHSFFFKPEQYQFDIKEEILKENNLYPLESYLKYWLESNRSAIRAIPSDQLLIIGTNTISTSHNRISKFLNISEESLSKTNTHEHKTKIKHGILNQLDSHHVEDNIQQVCGSFIEEIEDKLPQLFTNNRELKNTTTL